MDTKTILITLLDGPESLMHAIPSLFSIQKQHSAARITLLAGTDCTELADFLPPGMHFLTLENDEKSPINTCDFLFQLGQSRESIRVSEPIKAEEVFGSKLVGSKIVLSSSWDRFRAIMAEDNFYNPFHQTDLFRHCTQQTYADANFELAVPENLGQGSKEYFAGAPHIKIGVSLDNQSAEELQSYISAVLALDLSLRIYLIGTVKDRRLSSELLSRFGDSDRIIDLCGRLSLRESASITQGCDMLIAAPGLYSSLAAGFGTFCIVLDSTQGAEFYHYPYGHGHLILQRQRGVMDVTELGNCVADIVHFTILGSNGNIPTQERWQEFFDTQIDQWIGKIRIYLTQRVQVAIGEQSRTDLHLHPMIYTGAEFSDCIRSFYRLLWEQSLNGTSLAAYDLDVLHETTLGLLNALLSPLEQLYELASFGQKYTGFINTHLKARDLEKAKVDSARLQDVDNLIQILANTHPVLAPICHYFSLTQAQGQSTEIRGITADLLSAYRTLQQHVLILLDLQKSLYETTYENEMKLRLGHIGADGGAHG